MVRAFSGCELKPLAHMRNHLRTGRGIVALLAERDCACGAAGSLSYLTRASWLTEIELSF
jgi:hypothetical protein